ncbi:MAG TPA: proton-conducting transporter membrane subunit [Gemmatimonadaceae bacterium]
MTLFLAGMALLAVAAIIAGVARGQRGADVMFSGFTVAGAAVAAVPALRVLATGVPVTAHLRSTLPGGDWVFGIDALSAVFLLTVVGVGALTAIYGTAYMRHSADAGRRGWAHGIFALEVAALALVTVAQSAVLFLIAWELMAIGSFLTLVVEHEHAEVRRAGLMYLVATHTGTLALIAMFAAWGGRAGDWSFAALAASSHTLPHSGAAVLLLALVGFGVKAGLVPLHFWLPSAHSAAPSHVSALLSGVVIKMGVYGLLRVLVLFGTPPVWWGWTVLTIGAVSGVLGVLWALAQHDIKRLLAYHSVENIGIILMGVGVGALGAAYRHPALAVIGYAAAALHTVNHALFKSLLFLSAGAVYRATGTRNLEELGGLARRMPLTWIAFLVGSVAIIGLPPLNGFVSEWLVYQGLFRAGQTASGLRLAVLAAPALALIGGLALACFAKVAGVVFLGTARSDRALRAAEVAPTYHVAMVSMALACVVIGALPYLVLPSFVLAAGNVAGTRVSPLGAAAFARLIDARQISAVAFALVAVVVVLWLLRDALLRRRSVRTAPTWGCGYGFPTARMQYTASSFAAPLITLFGPASGVEEHVDATVYHSAPRDLVLDRAVRPLWARVQRAAERVRPIQQGRLHVYLLYTVGTVVAVLAYLMLASGA